MPLRAVKLHPSRSPIGTAVMSYLVVDPFLSEDAACYRMHASHWLCRTIALELLARGYELELLDRHQPCPSQSAGYNLAVTLAEAASAQQCVTDYLVAMALGADPLLHNTRVTQRAVQAGLRRNWLILADRLISQPERDYRILYRSQRIWLSGTKATLQTFSPELQTKTTLLPTPGSWLAPGLPKTTLEYDQQRGFLWYFGAGPICKGLDLVLEVFSRHPEWPLHIVGGCLESNPAFCQAYEQELWHRPNIKLYGWLDPSGPIFRDILRKVHCFVGPSASEGESTACVFCCQLGLYPVISRPTGLELPAGAGTYLETCSLEELEQAVGRAWEMPSPQLNAQLRVVQAYYQEHRSWAACRRAIHQAVAAIPAPARG